MPPRILTVVSYIYRDFPCLSLSRALFAPEEQRYRSRPRMAADRRSDAVNLDFSVQFFEAGFYNIRNRAGVVITGGIGNIAFARIIETVFGKLLHFLFDFFDDALFATDFESRNESAQIVHIEKRTNFQ